jgi:hypothetical protein
MSVGPFPHEDAVVGEGRRLTEPWWRWFNALARDVETRLVALELAVATAQASIASLLATVAAYAVAFTTDALTATTGAFTSLTTEALAFPATQVPSADANTLDDYEEGTFTPTLTFGGGATGMTYGTQLGAYTKVGNLVTVMIRIVLTAKGSSTGAAIIGGLPFATANDSHVAGGVIVVGANFSGLTSPPFSYSLANTSVANLADWGATGAVNMDDTNFNATTSLELVMTYRTGA